MKKILFLDTVHPVLNEILEEKGFICESDYESNHADICAKLHSYFGVVIRSRIPMDRTLMEAGKNLAFIARSGAGLENIDLVAAEDLGISVISSPEGNMDAVGEQAIGMLLSLFNNIANADAEVKQGIWKREENRGIELSAMTVGIIGFGKMGSALAKKLQGFDCEILAYDKYKSDYAPTYVTETSLEELQSKADIVSIHLPMSSETHYYVSEEFIARSKKPFFLVNTARGSHVKISDLVAGLENGKVRGACLDVLEYEKTSLRGLDFADMPEEFKRLCAHKNVILSPHVAGWTVESYVKLSTFLGEKICAEFGN